MKLQTQIPLKHADNQIDYQSRLLLIGSCFSENVGKKFDYFKFKSLQNPLGILFHPKSIENLFSKAGTGERYAENDIFFHNERWHCFDAHSDLSDTSKKKLLENLNRALNDTLDQIQDSTHVMITLGTAWVYRHSVSGRIVANCHKLPQNQFGKELLPVDEIVKSLENIIQCTKSINENIQFIFTVSPVRHLKDGFVENQRSKAHLITAVQNVIENSSLVNRPSYFFSYELLMDELRDYRFYKTDMMHPNQLAIDYIWEKFKQVWVSETAYPTMDKIETVQKGLSHIPFDPNSEKHRHFLKSLEDKIAYLQQEYPFIAFI